MKERAAYPGDLTDKQWAEVQLLIPAAEPGGREREVNMREVLNGIPYLVRGEVSWRMRPHGPLPWGMAFFKRQRLRWMDAGYQAGKDFCARVKTLLGWRVEVIKQPEINAQKKPGFVLLPRRWVVERAFA